MGNVIRKYISRALLVVNLLVFMLFTLVVAYVKINHSFLNVVFFLLLSAPLITLFTLRVIKLKSKKAEATFYYDRAFNILSLVNNYLFISVIATLIPVFKTVRAPLAMIYFIVFIIGFLVNIFELLLSLGFLDQLLPQRDLRALNANDTTKNLAREATYERIEARISPFYFFIALTAVLGVIFFIVPLVTEMFTIPLGGDYTQQQIPFYTNGYDDWWKFIKTGEFPLWDPNTFLGANNIGSNSFYYSMNPFFLPILLFPRDLIPQGIAVLMIGKFVLAAVTMRLYLKYMGVSEKEARIFAIIYAFSGWNTYYLWFNHFMEVAVIFPLIFLGIEKLLKEKKMTMLIIGLGLMGFANYFFLMTILVLGVIYAGFRYFQKLPNIEPSIIGLGILAFALGTLVSSVVLLPSLMISLNSDRVTSATYLENLIAAFEAKNFKLLWEILTKWENQSPVYDHKKYYPLISYFFPVLSDRSVALLNTSSYDNTISSLFSFSPVIILFIPALYVSIKKKKVSHLIAVFLFLFATFTPFAYNALHGFTKEYGRWQLMVTFCLVGYVATSLPDIKKERPFILDLSLVINLILMAFTVKVAFSYENKNGFSFMYEREYIIFYQFVMLFIAYLSFRLLQHNKYESYFRSLFVFVEIAVMGTVTMFGHGFISYRNSVTGGLASYYDDLDVTREIQALDKTYYRIFNTKAYKGNDNLPMRANYNGLTTFHSLYNFELMEFNEWSRINYNYNGWSLGIFERRGMINDFLQIKYYVLNDNDHVISWSDKTKTYAPYPNVPVTYSYREDLSTTNRFVYKMDNSFEIGFGVSDALTYLEEKPDGTFRNYITEQGRFSPINVEEMYLNAALLNIEDLRAVKALAPHLVTKTYQTYPRFSYSKYNPGNGLSVKYYETSRRYPYEAQIRGGSTFPTPEWLAEYATELAYGERPALLDGDKHVIEYTKLDGSNIIDEGGEIILNLPLAYYSSGSSYYNYNYNVFLYDEDYKLITFDNHLNRASASAYWKVMRSFHSPVAVKKMTLVPIRNRITPPYEHEIYTYTETKLNQIRENSLTNSLQDVKVTTNKITFKTDYAQSKFVVTTIPYDPGWTVVNANKEKLDVFKVQGGFVGFVSDAGEMTYSMVFRPTTFNIGLVLSLSALLITGLLELNVYYFKKYRKRQKESQTIIENERV